jgi:hypothetical protein
VWDRWDTGHYVTLALHGYNPATENPAFFPLYPLLMRFLEPVLPGGMLSAGLIISWMACVAALTVIHRLVEDLFDSDTAQRTALVLIAFPFGWYLCAAYPTSLFIALSDRLALLHAQGALVAGRDVGRRGQQRPPGRGAAGGGVRDRVSAPARLGPAARRGGTRLAVGARADRPDRVHALQLAPVRGSAEVRAHPVLLGPRPPPGRGPGRCRRSSRSSTRLRRAIFQPSWCWT